MPFSRHRLAPADCDMVTFNAYIQVLTKLCGQTVTSAKGYKNSLARGPPEGGGDGDDYMGPSIFRILL
jgi:hypothetical protein